MPFPTHLFADIAAAVCASGPLVNLIDQNLDQIGGNCVHGVRRVRRTLCCKAPLAIEGGAEAPFPPPPVGDSVQVCSSMFK